MDVSGTNTSIPLPAMPVQVSQPAPAVSQGPALPVPAPTGQENTGADFDLKMADQKQLAAVRQAAVSAADVYVVSDKKFTIFKDATGQYITRFVSLRDGKVTYVPAPELFKISNSSAVANAISIQA